MAETTVVQCPSCGARYQVDPATLGRTFTCASCKQPFQATAMAASPPVAGAPLPPAGYTGAMPPSPPMSPVGYATPGQELKTSGMAIASLVCGILFCVPFSSILAIVFGIIGITQTKPGQAKGRGMAIAGTVLGGLYLVLLLPLSIAILLPSLNKARETANRAKCASNMHQIGLAILLYQNDNRQEYPPDLTTLWKNEQLNGSVFVCPSSNDTPATTPDQLNSGGHLSYVYIKPATTSADANTVVLYENSTDHAGDGMNMLFGDGHAEWESAANAKQLVDQATAAAARH